MNQAHRMSACTTDRHIAGPPKSGVLAIITSTGTGKRRRRQPAANTIIAGTLTFTASTPAIGRRKTGKHLVAGAQGYMH